MSFPSAVNLAEYAQACLKIKRRRMIWEDDEIKCVESSIDRQL